MPLHFQADVHPAQADLNKLLRYSLGGLRPTKTARQTLSLCVFAARVRFKNQTEGCFIDDSIPTEIGTSKSTLYATQSDT